MFYHLGKFSSLWSPSPVKRGEGKEEDKHPSPKGRRVIDEGLSFIASEGGKLHRCEFAATYGRPRSLGYLLINPLIIGTNFLPARDF